MPSIRLLLLVLCIAPCAHAQQVYKWVDAQGRTHYSTTKPDAAAAKASEVNIKLPPQDPQETARARAATEAARAQKPSDRPLPKVPSPAQKPGWEYSNKPETNESRCAMARAIVEGRAQRTAGGKIDQNDRDIAQNDIKAFCR
jgi:hypothetical protein